jgi:hypothetical protein
VEGRVRHDDISLFHPFFQTPIAKPYRPYHRTAHTIISPVNSRHLKALGGALIYSFFYLHLSFEVIYKNFSVIAREPNLEKLKNILLKILNNPHNYIDEENKAKLRNRVAGQKVINDDLQEKLSDIILIAEAHEIKELKELKEVIQLFQPSRSDVSCEERENDLKAPQQLPPNYYIG